eukprot:SAG31_NODE_32103_length_360_cov_0.651341_1_plen_29_part_01
MPSQGLRRLGLQATAAVACQPLLLLTLLI